MGPDGSFQHDSLCFISDGNNYDTSFLYQVQIMLVDYLKANHPHIKKLFNFLMVVEDNTKTARALRICVPIRITWVSLLNWCFLQQAIENLPVKRHAAKQSLQRSLNNQILDLQIHVRFMWKWNDVDQVFWNLNERLISAENIEKWYEGWDTVPGTRSGHQFVPLLSSRVGHKWTSEDESYVDIHDFNIATLFEIGYISPSAHVTCIYNSFWWVGMVSLVDIAAGNVTNIDFMHPHGPQKTFN